MNGLEKSITFSLSDVMVKPATARSAFWKICEDRFVEREREREKVNERQEKTTTNGQVGVQNRRTNVALFLFKMFIWMMKN